MLIHHETLAGLVGDIFAAQGCSAAESRRIAAYLVAANLTGHDSHGVIRVPRYVGMLAKDEVRRDVTVQLLTDTPSFALVDGQYGFGQTVGPQAVQLGIAKARQAGVAVIGLRHAGHLGRIGEWAEMAADAGLCSIHFVNVAGSELVAPFGGVERRFSTAPFAAGFLVPGRAPVILDFATSLVAEGKVLVASNGGKKLPEGSLIEPDGRLSNDPETLYGPIGDGSPRSAQNGLGAIRAFGEHKGSGLALICELVAGALTGSGCAGPGPRPFSNGMFSIYMSPDHFGSPDELATETRRYIDYFKACRPAVPGDEVLLPGEPEARRRAERVAGGVPLTDEVWRSLGAVAQACGLDAGRYSPIPAG
ncbi:putative oxidoreductase [Inquilinus ginsengisoli]|uniref:Oxidoreductase n=1 Tax=Inquilinus ginsengisoli TaxID=363840 RepID=A0ABU1JQ39_9PROT|nr:Ldh family oxidoreductase [Inquilinus ginsengisoli]MDR6290732.1 putative oxidoreductase [Inquilinus ginsengisoli]